MWLKRKSSHAIFPIEHSDDRVILNESESDQFFERVIATGTELERSKQRQFLGTQTLTSRLRYALFALTIVTLLFLGRVAYLQLIKGTSYRALAENNRIYTLVTPSERGVIYDRNGLVLAKNIPVFQLILNPTLLPKEKESATALATELANTYGINPIPIYEQILKEKVDRETILLSDTITHEQAVLFLAEGNRFPGVSLEMSSKREYLSYAIPTLSHILGYVGIVNTDEYAQNREKGYRRFDVIGKQGIEKFYEDALRGTFGKTILEVDARGRERRIIEKTDPIPGEALTLSVDARFHTVIEQIIEARLAGTGATNASVVVMDPATGELLALVSWPAYDANLFSKKNNASDYEALLNDPRRPLFPRATSGNFPAGSTIKPIYIAGGLIEGIINRQTVIYSTGGIQVGPWFFPDWRGGGHGPTNMYFAIADSVNTFFYYLGGGYEDFEGLGVEKLMEYASLFGLGKQTHIDLFGDAEGFLPSKEWKEKTKGERWYIGDTYNVSIGQGDILVSPLQMARVASVFANGGFLVDPKLNRARETTRTQILEPDIVNEVRIGMRQTVTIGSAQSLQQVPVPVAGKTGTAQWSSTKAPHSWFIGFAPYDEPEIAISVLVEEGGDGLAIPIAREVLTQWFANFAE